MMKLDVNNRRYQLWVSIYCSLFTNLLFGSSPSISISYIYLGSMVANGIFLCQGLVDESLFRAYYSSTVTFCLFAYNNTYTYFTAEKALGREFAMKCAGELGTVIALGTFLVVQTKLNNAQHVARGEPLALKEEETELPVEEEGAPKHNYKLYFLDASLLLGYFAIFSVWAIYF